MFDLRDRFTAVFRSPASGNTVESLGTGSSSDVALKVAEYWAIAGGRNPKLRDALRDLSEAAAEAHEEGFPVPSNETLADARRLLRLLHNISPRRFEVYPTTDGEIAIDAPGGRNRSVVLLCGPDGGALCLVNMEGRHRRARYSGTGALPDGFIREALEELARHDDLAA